MTDRLDIRPKERFRKSLNDPAAFRAKMADPVMQDAIEAVLAEMALSPTYTREVLNGAIVFSRMLINLSEPDEARKPLPVQTLQSP